MRRPRFSLWFMVLAILAAIISIAAEVRDDAACRDRGGEPLWSRGGVVCLSPGITR